MLRIDFHPRPQPYMIWQLSLLCGQALAKKIWYTGGSWEVARSHVGANKLCDIRSLHRLAYSVLGRTGGVSGTGISNRTTLLTYKAGQVVLNCYFYFYDHLFQWMQRKNTCWHISWQLSDSKTYTIFAFIKSKQALKRHPMLCCGLILVSCRALYCIHHLLGCKEVPALLTAGCKTDSTQRMCNAGYIYCLPALLSWGVWDWKKEKKTTWIWFGGGGILNWFHSANCRWRAGLKSLRDTLSAGRPTDSYLDLAVPEACHIPPGGSDYVLYRETGPKHYGCFGLTTWVWHSWAEAWAKGNEKKMLNEWQMVA